MSAYGRLWDSGTESGFHLWRIHPRSQKSSNIGGSGVCRCAKWYMSDSIECPIQLKELRCNMVIVRGNLPKCLSGENKHKYTRVHDIQIAQKVVKGCGRT